MDVQHFSFFNATAVIYKLPEETITDPKETHFAALIDAPEVQTMPVKDAAGAEADFIVLTDRMTTEQFKMQTSKWSQFWRKQ